MTRHLSTIETMRLELRTLGHGNLLMIAERAIELMPATQLEAVFGDFMSIERKSVDATIPDRPLLDEARQFYEAGVAGQYYESIDINNKRGIELSKGSEAFIAEFDRLLRRCLRACEQEPPLVVRGAFELLFGLLRHIDEGDDDVIFFVDDGGSLDVGVNWRVVLPAYFGCLTKTTSADEYALEGNRVINDFVAYDKEHYLITARSIANPAQQVALDTIAQP